MGLLRRLVAIGCAAVLLLSGCQSGEVDPGASLSAVEEQLYQDAFETYSKFFELENAYEQQGGVEAVPDDIKQFVMGPELEAFEDAFVGAWRQGLWWSGENVNRIEKWQRADLEPNTVTFVAIDVCRYRENTDLMNSDGSLRAPADTRIVAALVEFARDVDGTIKVYDVNTERVESCPF